MALIKKLGFAAPLALSAAIAAQNAHSAFVDIDNPGFEDSGFDGWTEVEPAAVSGDSFSGSSSAKITGSGGRVSQSVNLVANTDYVLKAYILDDGEIGIDIGNATYTNQSSNDDWTEVTVEFNSGSNTSGVIFATYDGDEGRFDDFSLESLDTATESTPTSTPSSAFTVPGSFEAEDYADYSDSDSVNRGGAYRDDGVDIQVTNDNGNGFNVGWIRENEWLEYPINVDSSGTYTLNARVASIRSTGSFDVEIDGALHGSIDVSNTGGWHSWETVSLDIGSLSAGAKTLRILTTGPSYNLNWLELNRSNTTEPDPTPTPTPTPTPITPTPVAGDCSDMDLRQWGVTFPDGESLNDASDIQTYMIDQEPRVIDGERKDWITWENNCPTFIAPPNDDSDSDVGSSSSSSFIRSELRELLTMYFDDSFDDTDIENQWVTSEASNNNQNNAGGVNGVLRATLIVNSVTESGGSAEQEGRMIVGQIHGVDDEPVKIYYQKVAGQDKGSVYFTVDGSNGSPSDRITFFGYNDKITDDSRRDEFEPTVDGIALGDEWSYEIDLTGDQLQVTIIHDGKTYTTADGIAYSQEYMAQSSSGSGSAYIQSNSSDTDAITINSSYDNDLMYFKVGVYNQNNTGDGDDVASVTFTRIEQTHD